MTSEKEKTNKKWTSTKVFRDNYDKVFRADTENKEQEELTTSKSNNIDSRDNNDS